MASFQKNYIPENESSIERYKVNVRSNFLQEIENINEDAAEKAKLVHFTLSSDEFRITRWILRCLSLWHPQSACCVESIIYPVLINAMLFLSFTDTTVAHILEKPSSLHQYVSVYVEGAMYLGIYLTHLFGLLYFRSRDLEDNMINIELEPDLAIKFRHNLKRTTIWSVFILLSLTSLLIFLKVLLEGDSCESFMCLSQYLVVVYGVGVSLSVSWAFYLLQKTACFRLEQLEKRYYLWKATAEDAIYDYLINYSRRIKRSCSALSTWFIAHNFVLVLAIPLLIYDVLQVVKNIKQDPIDRTTFVLCWTYAIFMWVTPLLFAERLQIHDDNFISSVNKLCPGVIVEATENVTQNSSTEQAFTFRSRSEVTKLLTYLKSRKSGFLVGSYSFQLKLSMFSFGLALISLIPRVL